MKDLKTCACISIHTHKHDKHTNCSGYINTVQLQAKINGLVVLLQKVAYASIYTYTSTHITLSPAVWGQDHPSEIVSSFVGCQSKDQRSCSSSVWLF